MLVVVHDRDGQFVAQTLFNDETFRGFDVFEIDAAKSDRDVFNGFDKFFGVFGVHFDVEHVNGFEQ